MKKKPIEIPYSYRGLDLIVTLNYYPANPGKIYGPPENCYPPEPAEVDILSVRLKGEKKTNTKLSDWLRDELMETDECYDELCLLAEPEEPDYWTE